MRKNGSRLISIQQYRLTDLFLFALILVAFDLLSYYALNAFGASATFTFTLTVPLVLLVMMRWGWPCVLFAVLDGTLFVALRFPASWAMYLSYIIGYASVALLLIPLKFITKRKIAEKWYFSAPFVVLAWGIMNLVISAVESICGLTAFADALAANFGMGYTGLMSLAAALAVILVMRRLDGMFEDQRAYLKRLDDERKERMRVDEFGEAPVEIDEDLLKALKKKDDELE